MCGFYIAMIVLNGKIFYSYGHFANHFCHLSSFEQPPRVLSPFRGGEIAYLIDPDSYAGWSFIPLRATKARQVEG